MQRLSVREIYVYLFVYKSFMRVYKCFIICFCINKYSDFPLSTLKIHSKAVKTILSLVHFIVIIKDNSKLSIVLTI